MTATPTRNPDVATFANGQSIIVWERDFSATDHDIHARILNADGTGFTTADIINIDDTGGTFHEVPAVAASGNKALIVYEDEDNDDIVARLFDATTGSVGDQVLIGGLGNPLAPDVAALGGGGFVVVWENDDNDDIEGRLVDANGLPVGPSFSISNIGGNNTAVSVAGLHDGGFIVTWTNDGGTISARGQQQLRCHLCRAFRFRPAHRRARRSWSTRAIRSATRPIRQSPRTRSPARPSSSGTTPHLHRPGRGRRAASASGAAPSLPPPTRSTARRGTT